MTAPLDALKTFIESARWFGGKGRPFEVTDVRRLGWVETGTATKAAIDVVTLVYDDDGTSELYQLPLAFYPEREERLDHAFVGWWEEPELGGYVHVYDAPHDREAMAGWLAAFDQPATGGPLEWHRLPGHDLDTEAHSTLFSGEQSNSSLAFGDDALLKVFRKVTPGVNPDIAVHRVLTEAGSTHVAHLYGWLEVADDSGPPLQLAMLQQFLRTASDGWESALASVRNLFAEADLHADEVGGDFAGEAARLGESLAEVHQVLAEHFPTHVRTAEQQAELAAAMTGRLDAALDVVPELADVRRRPARDVRGRRRRGRRAGAAGARRPPPRPDAADRQGLEDRRLRGRARQAAGRAGAPGLPVARRGRHAAVLRLRPARGRAHRGPGRGRHRRRAAGLPGGRVGRAQLRGLPRRRTPAASSPPTSRRCSTRTSPTRRSTRPSTRHGTGPHGYRSP